jgi:hypothetical protein
VVKEKTPPKKQEKEEVKDVVMEDVSIPKQPGKIAKEIKLIEEKKIEHITDILLASKMEVDSEPPAVKLKENDTEKAESENSKARLCKRPAELKDGKLPDSKRKKTDKGEKNAGAEKRKIRHIEWQYSRHCSRNLWVGKSVKVKLPAKSQDNHTKYGFGKIIDIKENDLGQKDLFQIEWTNGTSDWIDLNKNKMYVFGQVLFLKNHQDSDQIEFIKSIYGWKSKDRKAIPIPVIELIDANDDNKKITPYEDSSEKIPVQYFTIERAKKIKQEVLYDYREFKEDYFDYLKTHVKNGDKLYNEILKYKKQYSQWIEKHSKVDIDIAQSLKSYCTKIVRVYKGDRNCGKAVVLR